MFIKPEFIELYTTVSSDVLAVGKIIEVPRSTNMNYVVNWLNLPTADLPVNFNRDHLRTHINKASKIEMDILKAGRNSFDMKYPNTKNPLGNKKAKRSNRKKAAVPSELPSITIAKSSLTDMNMKPSPNSGVRNVDNLVRPSPKVHRATHDRRKHSNKPPVDSNRLYEEDSASEDGSDLEVGDTYLPRDGTEDAVDEGYEPAFMETDGVYGDMDNIQFGM